MLYLCWLVASLSPDSRWRRCAEGSKILLLDCWWCLGVSGRSPRGSNSRSRTQSSASPPGLPFYSWNKHDCLGSRRQRAESQVVQGPNNQQMVNDRNRQSSRVAHHFYIPNRWTCLRVGTPSWDTPGGTADCNRLRTPPSPLRRPRRSMQKTQAHTGGGWEVCLGTAPNYHQTWG